MSSQFAPGPNHPRFRDGGTANEHGYRRVTVGRRNQMPYEHRWVIEQLMLEKAVLDLVEEGRCGEYQVVDDDLVDPVHTSTLAIMELIQNPPRIAPGVQVHHIDFDRQHNCPQNLMLLDGPLHRAITTGHRRFRRRHEENEMYAALRGVADAAQ